MENKNVNNIYLLSETMCRINLLDIFSRSFLFLNNKNMVKCEELCLKRNQDCLAMIVTKENTVPEEYSVILNGSWSRSSFSPFMIIVRLKLKNFELFVTLITGTMRIA